MVSAGRVAMGWITLFVVLIVSLLISIVLAPQIEIWSAVLSNLLDGLSTAIDHETVNSWVNMSFWSALFIVNGGTLIWCVCNCWTDMFSTSPMYDDGGY